MESRKLVLRREQLTELTGDELGRVDGGTDSVQVCVRTLDGCVRTIDGCVRTIDDCVASLDTHCLLSRVIAVAVTTSVVHVC